MKVRAFAMLREVRRADGPEGAMFRRNGAGAPKVRGRSSSTARCEFLPAEHVAKIPGGSTVGDLLEHLSARHPGLRDALFTPAGELGAYVNILKNGRNIHFSGGLETPLEDGDTVALFPPAGGG
ncbi:MAG: sulfur-carrier protein [Methanoculleus sp.]|nr:sulfur-carrier protein [Methanoculleus sp.]